MSCLHPIPAVDDGIDSETGKHIIRFIKMHERSLDDVKRQYGDRLVLIPCGKCIECKKKYASDWAARCELEAMDHTHNYFITLTYDDLHLPKLCSTLKHDFQLFIKSVRNSGHFIRYFGCGERGESGDRFHLHLIAFGLDIPDLHFEFEQNGSAYYSSEFISKCWKHKGLILISDFSYNTARYVAGYTAGTSKKSLFRLASRRPSIGANYIYRNYQHAYKYDHISLCHGDVPIPRSFDLLIEKIDPELLQQIKDKRLNLSRVIQANDRCIHGDDLVDYQINRKAFKAVDDFKRKGGNNGFKC